MRMGTSASYLHAFVIFFYAALLVNILYPTFLLRSRHVAFQRDASFVADTVLDVVYAVVPFLLLALGIRRQAAARPSLLHDKQHHGVRAISTGRQRKIHASPQQNINCRFCLI